MNLFTIKGHNNHNHNSNGNNNSHDHNNYSHHDWPLYLEKEMNLKDKMFREVRVIIGGPIGGS